MGNVYVRLRLSLEARKLQIFVFIVVSGLWYPAQTTFPPAFSASVIWLLCSHDHKNSHWPYEETVSE